MAQKKIKPEVLDELLSGRDPQTVFSPDGLVNELKKALAERILNAERDVHLEQAGEQATGNHRNGTSPKTVLSETGSYELSIPRDRQGHFAPQLIAKYQRRFPGFDENIIGLYARDLNPREIQGHLRELYGVEISPELVSAVAAKKLGRRYLGIEIDRDYCLLAQKRLEIADTDATIQGYVDGVFWERNTLKILKR